VIPEHILTGDMEPIVIAITDKAQMLDYIKQIHVYSGCRAVSKANTNVKSAVRAGLGEIPAK